MSSLSADTTAMQKEIQRLRQRLESNGVAQSPPNKRWRVSNTPRPEDGDLWASSEEEEDQEGDQEDSGRDGVLWASSEEEEDTVGLLNTGFVLGSPPRLSRPSSSSSEVGTVAKDGVGSGKKVRSNRSQKSLSLTPFPKSRKPLLGPTGTVVKSRVPRERVPSPTCETGTFETGATFGKACVRTFEKGSSQNPPARTNHQLSRTNHADMGNKPAHDPREGPREEDEDAYDWSEHVSDYLEDKQPSTQTKYKLHLKKLFEYLEEQGLHTKRPEDITAAHLKRFKKHTLEHHSDGVARSRVHCLHSFWKHLFQEEVVTKNRAERVKPTKAPEAQGKERNLSEDDVKRIGEACKKDGPKSYAMFALMYLGALRRHECAKLRSDECTVESNKDGDEIVVLKFRGKGNKLRTVPLSKIATPIIMPFLQRAQTTTDRWLFPGRNPEKHITGQAVYDRMKKNFTEAGLPDASPHWLRHAHITHAIQRGSGIATTSKGVGHTSIATTSGYLHADKEDASSNYLTFGNEKNEQNEQQPSSSSSSASLAGNTSAFKLEVLKMFKGGDITKKEMMEML